MKLAYDDGESGSNLPPSSKDLTECASTSKCLNLLSNYFLAYLYSFIIRTNLIKRIILIRRVTLLDTREARPAL